MANGELCKKCGCQETTHELEPKITCTAFESEVEHDKDCPILDCNGNCKATIKRRDWEGYCAEQRASNVWVMRNGVLYRIDTGT